jgi:hypothetical protein
MAQPFNSKEYYQAKPNERFAIAFYYQRQKIMECDDDNRFLKEVRKLEADLINCYNPPPTNMNKPHSAKYLAWRRKLTEKIREKRIRNPFSVGITIYRELMMIANEAGLIGGSEKIGIGIVTDGENLDVSAGEEEE